MCNIMVSVLCATYNHEKYIKDALDGFIRQQTTFPFEVIVHDDASTDRTAEIVREYAEKYPDLIRPFYEIENQYSKGIGITKEIMLPQARGKYFAFCEGDDYWTDSNKLQKQVEYMESHPECTLCIHNSIDVREDGQYLREHIIVDRSKTVTCEEVLLGDGNYCATSSILAPTKLVQELPAYFDHMALDLIWQAYLSSCGETYCFAEKMSSYRNGANGSWTQKFSNQSVQRKLDFYQRIMDFYDQFNEETENRYISAIHECKLSYELKSVLAKRDKEEFKRDEIQQFLHRRYHFLWRMTVWINMYLPSIYRFLMQEKIYNFLLNTANSVEKRLRNIGILE